MSSLTTMPERIGSYQVLRRLGSGATSTVYLATRCAGLPDSPDETAAPVAIKLLHTELAREIELVLRFHNEFCAARRVEHPGVIRVYGVEQLPGGSPYLIMEPLGPPLSEVFAEGPLSPPEVVGLARQIAAALAALHAAGVVHRDLKPQNIMFDPLATGQVKVVDLGLAKISDAVGAAPALPVSTAGTEVLGTPDYRAPEAWVRAKDVDGKADVYSLGVLLFEALTGTCPFLAADDRQRMELHLFAPPPPLPAVPVALRRLIGAMLDKSRVRRPTMAEVQAALDLMRAR